MPNYRITLHETGPFLEHHRLLHGVSSEEARAKAWILLTDRLRDHLGFPYSETPPHTLEVDCEGSRVLLVSDYVRFEASIVEIPDTNELYDFCRQGRKIDAIRCLRRMTGQGLKASKEEVERWMPAFNS